MVKAPVKLMVVAGAAHTALLLAVSVIRGLLLTVTIEVLPVAVQPLPSVTVTLYAPVAVGAAVVAPVLVGVVTIPDPAQEYE